MRAILTLIFLVIAFLGTLLWASFAQTPFSRHVLHHIQNAMSSPLQTADRAEIDEIFAREFGRKLRDGDLPPFEIGLVAWPHAYFTRDLLWIVNDPVGGLRYSRTSTSGFVWNFWHLAQGIRAISQTWRNLTLSRKRNWLEMGVAFLGETSSYNSNLSNQKAIFYCYPLCFRMTGNIGDMAYPRHAFGTTQNLKQIRDLLSSR